MVLADNRIGLPVAVSLALLDNLRALFNRAAVGHLASAIVRAVALAPLLATAQVMKESAAHLFVRIDVLIDALVADTAVLSLGSVDVKKLNCFTW
jgi:hypothetical protein